MMRRLLDRNIAIMVVVVLTGQLLAAALLYQLVMRPQALRLAQVTAEMTDTIGKSMASMSPANRRALVARFNADDAVLMRPGDQPPDIGLRPPTLIEDQFLVAISHRLNHDQPVEWRTDTQARLWVHLWLGGEDWWVSLTPRRLRAPLTSTLIALASALFVSIAGGIALQRLLDRPLRQLVQAVDAYDPDRINPPLAETGPEEIAAVGQAFNRMRTRLADQEAERALLLAAVSHDLRTPLARLRLSLAMMHEAEADLRESAGRQVDYIEVMLEQFLDFARGFDSEALEVVDLTQLLTGAAQASGLGSQLVVDVPASSTALVRAVALERAVTNLLANAEQHGRTPFRLQVKRSEDELRICVEDSGPGFDPADGDALCRPFSRGNVARTGGGTGLGLAIVQRIAAAHGGTVSFTRQTGLFRVTIELPQPNYAT